MTYIPELLFGSWVDAIPEGFGTSLLSVYDVVKLVE